MSHYIANITSKVQSDKFLLAVKPSHRANFITPYFHTDTPSSTIVMVTQIIPPVIHRNVSIHSGRTISGVKHIKSLPWIVRHVRNSPIYVLPANNSQSNKLLIYSILLKGKQGLSFLWSHLKTITDQTTSLRLTMGTICCLCRFNTIGG